MNKPFPELGPTRWRSFPSAFAALRAAVGNWEQLDTAWCSLMVSPGMLLYHVEKGRENDIYLALNANAYGVLAKPVLAYATQPDGDYAIDLTDGVDDCFWKQLQVLDPDEWKAVQVKAMNPMDAKKDLNLLTLQGGIHLVSNPADGEWLGAASARTGFKAFTCPF